MGKSHVALRIVGRVLIIIVIVFCILAAGAFGTLQWITGALSVEHQSKEMTLAVSGVTLPKRALVIYQPSRTDMTKTRAMAIAKAINDRGYQVTLNYPGNFLNENLTDYDVLVLGTPVYMEKISPVLDRFIKRIKGLERLHVLFFETGMTEVTDEDEAFMNDIISGAASVSTVKFISGKDEENAKLMDKAVNEICN